MSLCKACGEEIRWIRTTAGKPMPVDPDSFGQHPLVAGVVVVTDSGIVLRGGRSVATAAYGYTPHWATCPHADTFRGRNRQDGQDGQDIRSLGRPHPVNPV